MKFLHTMLRVKNLDAALHFYVNQLGLVEVSRKENEKGRFTLVFLGPTSKEPLVELTYNWDNTEPYGTGRFFGHLAFGVENIYDTCERLQKMGVDILRPPRDGHMAFVKSPDGASVELLQLGEALPPQAPWNTMENQGSW